MWGPWYGIVCRVLEPAVTSHHLTVKNRVQPLLLVVRVSGGEPRDFVLRREEARILHPQRLEEARREKFIERHARDHFHKTAQDVIRQAVFPVVSRLEQQRYGRELLDPVANGSFLLLDAAADARIAVSLAQPGVPLISQSGGVR